MTPRKKTTTQNTRPTTRTNSQSRTTTKKTSAGRSGARKNTRRQSSTRRVIHRTSAPRDSREKKREPIPEIKDGVRIIPLGGVEEVGRNMTIVETKDDIVIVDAGFQFVSEEAPGVDYILPNTHYLEERKDKIRAILITHGHLDHIGGIPFILDRIGNPPIYTGELTAFMIKKRAEEFPSVKHTVKTLDPDVPVTLGSLKVRTFPVTHSIPDSTGMLIETKDGNIVLSGDLKLEHKDGVPSEREEKVWSKVGSGKNLMFIADSTNAERGGFSVPEQVVFDTLEDIIRKADGRIIIGTFASQFERMIRIIETCEKLGKKVAVEGRSIKTNLEIAKKAERLKAAKATLIPIQEVDNYPPDKLVVLATGAQGEKFAALMRIATGQHKFLKMTKRDTVVLSSSVIPGNEVSVQRLKDNLYRHAGHVIHYRTSDVHSTGHGNTGELVWINQKVGAKFFMPAYGYYSMTRCHADAVIESGFPEKNIVVADNGTIVDIVDGGERMIVQKASAPSGPMMVDGFSVGNVQDVVIRDRQNMAQDGMFVVIATINLKTGKLRKSPDIISRGFVYLRESQDLLQQTRLIVKKSVEETTKGMRPVNFDMVKDNITDTVSAFLFQKTNKHPIVIPVLLGV
ncbi:MAG: ribonuclease J [Candidatus Pacebacteria bacterium]|nr:ribonuclease J [Candidatus Paceibacterota bacterium]